MSSVHFSLDINGADQSDSGDSADDISVQVESMSAAEAQDLDTILSEYPDIEKLHSLVVRSIDALPQSHPTQSGIKVIKDGINRLLKNIASLKVPATDQQSISELAQAKRNQSEIEDVKGLKDEIMSLYLVRDQLITSHRQQKRKYEEEMDRLVSLNSILSDEHQELLSQMKTKNDYISRVEMQVNEASQDSAALAKQIMELREKLDQKSTKIINIKEKNNRLENSLRESQLALCQAELKITSNQAAPISASNNTAMQAEIDKLNETINELHKISEEQTMRILQLANANNDLGNENNSYIKRNSELKKQYDSMNLEYQKTNNLYQKFKLEIEEMRESNDELLHKFNKANDELEELKFISNKILLAAKEVSDTSLENVDQLIKNLASMKSDEDILDENTRLRALVDTLARFFDASKTSQNKSGVSILDKNAPLLGDDDVRIELERRINNIRVTSKVDNDKVDAFEQLFGNELVSHETMSKITRKGAADEYASVFALSAINESLQSEIESKAKLLEPLRRVLPQKYEKTEIFAAVAEYFSQLEPLIDDLTITTQTILEYSNKEEQNKFIILQNYVKESTMIFSELLNQLRPLAMFCGTIVDLPSFLKDYITSLTNQIRQAKTDADARESQMNRSIHDLQNSQNATQDAVAFVSNQYESRIASVNETLKKAQTEVEHLKEKLEIEADDRKQLENTINALNQRRDETDNASSTMRNENLRLRNLLNERASSYQKRLEEAMKSQQNHHDEELARLEKKKNDQIASIDSQLQAKTQKLEKLKITMKENNEMMQKSISAQRESIQMMMKQNAELTSQCVGGKEIKELQYKVKELEGKLQESNQAKYQLVLQMNRFNSVQTTKSDSEFLKQIGEKLINCGCKQPETGWSQKGILSEMNSVSEKIRLSSLNTSFVPRVKSMTSALSQWNEWSIQLVKKINEELKPETLDPNAIRSIISDSVKINTQKAKTIELMQSLRAQKSIFKSGLNATPKSKELNMGGVASALLFLSIIKHRAQLNNARAMLESVTTHK